MTAYAYDALGRVDQHIAGFSYTYDPQGRIRTYTPGFPSGYGSISYTWNNLGERANMTVPLGENDRGRNLIYRYDAADRQSGMDVVPVSVTSSVSTPCAESGTTTRFAWDARENRVKLVDTQGEMHLSRAGAVAPLAVAICTSIHAGSEGSPDPMPQVLPAVVLTSPSQALRDG